MQELQREFGEFDRTIAILQNDIKARPYAVQLHCVRVGARVRAWTFCASVHLFFRADYGLSLRVKLWRPTAFQGGPKVPSRDVQTAPSASPVPNAYLPIGARDDDRQQGAADQRASAQVEGAREDQVCARLQVRSARRSGYAMAASSLSLHAASLGCSAVGMHFGRWCGVCLWNVAASYGGYDRTGTRS